MFRSSATNVSGMAAGSGNPTPAASPKAPQQGQGQGQGHTPHDSGSEGGSSEQNAHEASSLLFAVSRGKTKAVLKYLENGVDVNCKDYDGRTALHVAAATGGMELIKLLHERAANMNAKDRWGHSPLDEALSSGHNGAAELIKSLGGLPGAGKTKDPSMGVPLDPQSSTSLLLMYALSLIHI